MPSVCNEAISKTTNLTVPNVQSRGLEVCLGITNCFFFGIGTIIAGFMANDLADVLIGVGQLFIPFVGWIWSIVWGVKMIIGKSEALPSPS